MVQKRPVTSDSVPQSYSSLFQCAMLAGARLGELLGLQWKHLNFGARTLEIRQALWDGELVAPKTEGSIRAIYYFGPSLLAAPAAQKHNSNHNGPDNFVFCKKDGSPLNPDVLRRDVLYPSLDRLGIARSRAAGFHTFRHSAATIDESENCELKARSKVARTLQPEHDG